MKRITGMLLALAFLLPGLTTFAKSSINVGPEGKVKVKTEATINKEIKVQLVNLQKETTTVMLEDMQGNEYYKKIIKNHNGFARNLNLNDLGDGRYLLSVVRDNQKWVQVVLVEDETVRLSKMVRKS